jgi:nitrite reductase/ring-hydroxylating ferredoxin subunit
MKSSDTAGRRLSSVNPLLGYHGPMSARAMDIPPGQEAPGTESGAFEPVASLDQLPEGSMLRVTRGDLDLLLVHTPRGVCLTDDRCPHMSAPLSLGVLDDCTVACPLHQGRFDLLSGAVVQFPTTGGLDVEGNYHPPWAPPGSLPKPQPSDIKAQARAATRVRRMRYYPVRINRGVIEGRLPG